MENLSAQQQQDNFEINQALEELTKEYKKMEHKHRNAHKQLAENNHLLNAGIK